MIFLLAFRLRHLGLDIKITLTFFFDSLTESLCLYIHILKGNPFKGGGMFRSISIFLF